MFDSRLIFYSEWVIAALNIASIIILLVGVFLVLKNLFNWQTRKKNYDQRNCRNAEIRKLLASYILLSLEVLVVADIIESVIKPTWIDILKLAVIIIIRTIISYFLNLETQDKKKVKAGISNGN
ncbi:hypothetical protein BH747_09860 [Enterococcus villorum]|jgi:uncharacterized membrane protein|uniref:Membrane protein n=2 Tax=Enterococcus villorum TaxID=112904 RepID=A0A1V8YJ80_9ENTE|nr:DUF1622 domain-containing protein [Enterococcus villorum]EOH93504.1 hypothetical protein UAO_00233 [Enterococcus villorum ATCC 700913]EOW75455.1 hypothetical protein I591_02544 [Enterococcus villorum ATCC 700913]OQO69567.1 hypothetical protein BH747_09860 [Enterococcus villorum]OQO72642.1 hypothetical protein BH744_11240 [Enterococcus villorum]GEL92711.1 membrane protein [Enterococcus villorum]